jgi:hypothetical protein
MLFISVVAAKLAGKMSGPDFRDLCVTTRARFRAGEPPASKSASFM